MRIEQQLTEAYHAAALDMTSPAELDERIKNTHEKQTGRKRKTTSSKRTLQIVFIGLLALMIMGFTARYFITLGDDRFRMEIEVNAGQTEYNESLAGQVRAQLEQVKAQLKVGEKALVYSPEIAAITPEPPSGGEGLPYVEYVSNPVVYENYAGWQAKLSERLPEFRLPAEETNGLKFKGGEEELPFGGTIFETDVARELQSEVNDEGKDIAWRKIVRENSAWPAYTTIYNDAERNEIKVSMQIIAQRTKMVGLAQAVNEKVDLNGTEALYTLNNRFLYSDTNQFQMLSWIETLQDVTVVYSVGSSSESVTKERLIAIGEGLVGH
ncbi:hypothetical protein [Cohnella cholangitidis]|uniref:DUF4367 domain-containing protein n=1 Tax=Cohnella cholangitidis TaxID=2598458 RepID=A0A7G5C0M8_9BACL|nr:hypothetical protein [Cohnella cholangitidis]QMV42762.1 hypothetical protein FPL14_17375 [Cohnella cholangitidis]